MREVRCWVSMLLPLRGRMGRIGLIIAIISLGGCGSPTPVTVHGKSVDYWLHALHDRDAAVRHRAVQTLSNVGVEDPFVLPALIETLEDRDVHVREAAVLALLKMGPEAKEAIPALERRLKDKDAKIRSSAAKALELIERDSK